MIFRRIFKFLSVALMVAGSTLAVHAADFVGVFHGTGTGKTLTALTGGGTTFDFGAGVSATPTSASMNIKNTYKGFSGNDYAGLNKVLADLYMKILGNDTFFYVVGATSSTGNILNSNQAVIGTYTLSITVDEVAPSKITYKLTWSAPN